VHTPATQVRLPLQRWLHAPQLFLSEAVSTQAPEQAERPALHWTPHFCAMQVAEPLAGTGQLLPQAPQFAVSDSMLAHSAPQRASGD
jgi:hypothetical protein